MKNIKPLFLVVLLLFFGCRKEEKTPKLTYPDPQKEEKTPELKIDSAQIKVADLPIHIENTKYLIHPIGNLRLYNTKYSKSGSYSKNSFVSYSISNYNNFMLTGYLSNLKLQHMDSTNLKTLTDNIIEIQSVTYLDEISKKIGQDILIYTLADSDTNRDGKINSNDIKTLYISEINGTNFVKLSNDLEELIEWNSINSLNRLYFRTIRDINKNGSFDQNDSVHYYYVDLKKSISEVVEYNPME